MNRLFTHCEPGLRQAAGPKILWFIGTAISPEQLIRAWLNRMRSCASSWALSDATLLVTSPPLETSWVSKGPNVPMGGLLTVGMKRRNLNIFLLLLGRVRTVARLPVAFWLPNWGSLLQILEHSTLQGGNQGITTFQNSPSRILTNRPAQNSWLEDASFPFEMVPS